MSFNSQGSLKKPFLVLLTIGLIVRFILMPLLTMNSDVAYWIQAISLDLNNIGLYDVEGYYYSPIWGYLMDLSIYLGQFVGVTDLGIIVPELAPFFNTDFALNEIVSTFGFNIIIKFVLVLCDVAVALIIYDIAMKLSKDEKKSILAAALWFLSPLVISQSSVHAMFDCLSAMAILLSVSFILERKYFLTGVMFSIAVLTKFFPLFFFFILIVILFRNEGFGKKGIDSFRNAFVGAFLTLIVVELPYIINGEFFRSMDFIIGRLGVAHSALAPFSPYIDYVFLIGIALIVSILIILMRKYGEGVYERYSVMDGKERDKRIFKKLLIIAGLITVVLVITTIVNYPEKNIDFVEFVSYLGTKIVSIVMVYALLLEVFIAYRILFSKDANEKVIFTGLMLTSLAIFLWPPLPQYVLVSLPFIILYATVYENRLIKPCIIMMCLMTLMDVPGYFTALQTVAYYVPGISFDIILEPISFFTLTTFGIENIVYAVVIFGVPAYLSFLNLIRVWYLTTKEGTS